MAPLLPQRRRLTAQGQTLQLNLVVLAPELPQALVCPQSSVSLEREDGKGGSGWGVKGDVRERKWKAGMWVEMRKVIVGGWKLYKVEKRGKMYEKVVTGWKDDGRDKIRL